MSSSVVQLQYPNLSPPSLDFFPFLSFARISLCIFFLPLGVTLLYFPLFALSVSFLRAAGSLIPTYNEPRGPKTRHPSNKIKSRDPILSLSSFSLLSLSFFFLCFFFFYLAFFIFAL
jgi:hypothetical protein